MKRENENENEKMVSILFQHSNQTIDVIKREIDKLPSAKKNNMANALVLIANLVTWGLIYICV